MSFFVYILASKRNGTLYTGHTDDLSARIWAHKEGRGAIFTRKYGVKTLVWYEMHDTRESAKIREYQIKAWKRDWKLRMVERTNPEWEDLYFGLNG
ncbi:MAG: GIY-YIG nuclease family protein [Hyphomonas sp.]